MKLLLKLFTIIFSLMLIGVFIIIFVIFGPEERDQINPFIDEEMRYFIVTEDGKLYGPKGLERYEYYVTAYNEALEPKDIHVTAAINLRHNAVIEVTTKGKHVETWREIQLNDLSTTLQQKLQNN